MILPSADEVSQAVDTFLNSTVTGAGSMREEADLTPSQIWDAKEEPFIVAQRLFCAEIARRTRDVRRQRNASLSPFSKLPVELQVDIFSGATEPRRISRQWSTLEDLSTVSSHWHAIIQGTPSLWSNISLDMSLWRFRKGLELSSGARIMLKGGAMEANMDFRRYVALFRPHAFRCRSIDISYTATVDLRPLLNISLPQLESLVLSTFWSEHEIVISTMPRLRRLSLTGVKLSPGFGKLEFLKHLDLGWTTTRLVDLINALRLCPNLAVLMLSELIEETSHGTFQTSSIPLPHLTNLHLASNAPNITFHVLTTIQPGHLTEFEIYEISTNHPNVFMSLLRTNAPPLLSELSRSAVLDQIQIELGEPNGNTAFSIAGLYEHRKIFKIHFRESNPSSDLVAALQTLRELFGAAWATYPVALKVRRFSLEWNEENLHDLWDLLNVTSLDFSGVNTWPQLLRTLEVNTRWPYLHQICFPEELTKKEEIALFSESIGRLVEGRGGGLHTLVMDYGRPFQRIQCVWVADEIAQ